MTQKTVNYAEVLYQLGIEPDVVVKTNQLIKDNPALSDALTSPLVDKGAKKKIIDRIFPQQICNYLKVLCENDGIVMISQVCDEYMKLKSEKAGILQATLYYVTPPTEEQKKGIEKFLCKEYKKDSVELLMVKQEELIGGFVIRTGDHEYDWSILGRYNSLRQKLVMR
ncbi:MAG: ATP synthase F1 subunit delta [Coprococcus sp.]